MRAAVALVALVAIGGVALGEVTPSAPAPTPAADVKQGANVIKARGDNKGRKMRRQNGATKPADTATKPADTATKPADTGTKPGDSYTSCLELWDPATHMTKREWARACRRVDERLKSITLR
jgi:hypothetical protein